MLVVAPAHAPRLKLELTVSKFNVRIILVLSASLTPTLSVPL